MEEIKIEHLSFTYPGEEKKALDDINLTVNRGEFAAIFGKSGSGKSTLLRHIKKSLAPNGSLEGRVLIGGIPELSEKEEAQKIGFVPQSAENAIVCDKVWHELVFGLENIGTDKEKIRIKAAETAAFFGLEKYYQKDVSELSGGQKRILNLASVMVMQPEILILDEPTSMLDPIAAHELVQMLKKINEELGTTIILSEHNSEEIFPVADRVILLSDGSVASDCPPCEAVESFAANGMYLSLPASMRVFFISGDDGKAPVSVKECRNWLSKKNVKRDASFKDKKRVVSEAALEMKDVWFRYEKNGADILKGLSIKVNKGEFYAVVGGNGVGKTTAVSVMAGILKPYSGKVLNCGRITALSQNPKVVFSHKTLIEDLEFMLEGEDRECLTVAVKLCGLENLLYRHPYDLSGGEQQRAAIAMALLTKPEILILDEPTKRLDSEFKEKLASLLKNLAKQGMTVIAVSHDIEFCAGHADYCAMLFDGAKAAEGTPRELFGGNCFYTTAVCRAARGIILGAVLDEDIAEALGKKIEKREEKDNSEDIFKKSEIKTTVLNKKKKSDIFAGIFFAVVFLCIQIFLKNTSGIKNNVGQILSIISAGLAFLSFVPRAEFEESKIQSTKKISKRTAVAAAAALLAIPFTIFCGIAFLGDRKYYFISLLIIWEIMLPFFITFEGRKPNSKELAILSVLCAAAVCSRTIFAPFPQLKPVAAIVIMSGIVFGGEAGFLVGAVSAFVSNFFFGQGPWTPWQMFAFGIIGFCAGIVFGKNILRKNRLSAAIFGFFSVMILYGGIMNPASLIMSGAKITPAALYTSYAIGVTFDIIHAVSTFFFLYIAAEPICERLGRIKRKYGI